MSRIEKFILQENNGIKYYTIPAFSNTGLVNHGFSTRVGGCSKEPYHTLNLGLATGDDLEIVKKNRTAFAQALKISPDQMVAAGQVHGENICPVDQSYWGKGVLEQGTAVKDTDALMTDRQGVALIAFYADCVPVLFLDPVKKVIGIAHAGWKGTVLEIARKTVQRMNEIYGCSSQNILAAIGPSIGPCHYEVDELVIDRFRNSFSAWTKILAMKTAGKAQLNLWEANRIQLLEAGLTATNITMAEICTYCHPELLYSYRYNYGKTGRMAGLIMLKEE
ncbi:MAG: peptidoglycan editing factor PgeF [Peptococcaceae bacterium]